MATTKEYQEEKSVQDTQMPTMSPPHDKDWPKNTINVKDVPNISS